MKLCLTLAGLTVVAVSVVVSLPLEKSSDVSKNQQSVHVENRTHSSNTDHAPSVKAPNRKQQGETQSDGSHKAHGVFTPHQENAAHVDRSVSRFHKNGKQIKNIRNKRSIIYDDDVEDAGDKTLTFDDLENLAALVNELESLKQLEQQSSFNAYPQEYGYAADSMVSPYDGDSEIVEIVPVGQQAAADSDDSERYMVVDDEPFESRPRRGQYGRYYSYYRPNDYMSRYGRSLGSPVWFQKRGYEPNTAVPYEVELPNDDDDNMESYVPDSRLLAELELQQRIRELAHQLDDHSAVDPIILEDLE